MLLSVLQIAKQLRDDSLSNEDNEIFHDADFASEAEELTWSYEDGHLDGWEGLQDLTSLCLDIRERCEKGGATKNAKRACKILLNKENVPQRMRDLLWQQLLRKDMGEIDSDNEDESNSHVWRRTTADPVASRDTQATPLKSVQLLDTPREKQQQRLDDFAWPPSKHDSGLYIGEDVEKTQGEPARPGQAPGENALIDRRIETLLAEQKKQEFEALERLNRLTIESIPTVGYCTCWESCHCIYGMEPSTSRRTGPSSEPDLTEAERAGAGLVIRPTFTLGWYDTEKERKEKSPFNKRWDSKRDSTRGTASNED